MGEKKRELVKSEKVVFTWVIHLSVNLLFGRGTFVRSISENKCKSDYTVLTLNHEECRFGLGVHDCTEVKRL